MTDKKLKVLVLDDEKRLSEEISEFLENASYSVRTADRPSAALSLIKQEEPDLILIDIKLPEYDGLTFLKRLRDEYPAIEAVIMSGHGDMDSVIEAFRLGAFDYLRKPFSSFELQAAIGRTGRYLEAQAGRRRYAALCRELNTELSGTQELVGASAPMQQLRTDIERAASHPDTPVLILGESGTGKELAARQLHRLSLRSTNRFVAVNCAAIPREIFESEFFGHVKGAFTDARTERPGLFRTANGGTLFLDEIGEVPYELQSKLLRVIEQASLRPVGADREYKVDVRIICATNKNLAQAIQDGHFRSDLYYRLAVMELKLPPLRERKEDIPILADLFMTQFCERSGTPRIKLSEKSLDILKIHSYPGNVRELKNLTDRIGILGRDPSEKELEAWIHPTECCRSVHGDQDKTNDTSLNLEELEKKALLAALKKSGNVQVHAARLLGISRQSLDRRLNRYGIKV